MGVVLSRWGLKAFARWGLEATTKLETNRSHCTDPDEPAAQPTGLTQLDSGRGLSVLRMGSLCGLLTPLSFCTWADEIQTNGTWLGVDPPLKTHETQHWGYKCLLIGVLPSVGKPWLA